MSPTDYGFSMADFAACFPLVVVVAVGLLVVLLDAFKNDAVSIPWLTGGALLVGLGWELAHLNVPGGTAFYGMVRTGGFASFVNVILFGSGFLTVVLMAPYLDRIRHHYGEVYALLLFSIAGMVLLGTGNNLVTLFVGLETMSVALYILTALVRDDEGGIESGLKYFLLGAFSSGFFLYGIALLYGATGTMYLPAMPDGLARTGATGLFWGGVGLLLVGFLFKVSAAPFHMWTPDVYQGAPTPLTGFMATASKASAFAGLIVVLSSALPAERWQLVLAVVAVVTMVVGNVIAYSQRNVKRLLAYSSIAHAGYVLVGLAAGTPAGYAGALYYLLVYAVMNVGAFGVMAYLEWDGKEGREQTLDSLAGIGFRRPLLGVVMGFCMLSLLGFPPLAGFFGKVFVFAPAVEAGLSWLVVVGVLASAVSAAYYLRVLWVMWMKAPEEGAAPVEVGGLPRGAAAALVACAALLVLLSFAPTLVPFAERFFAPAATVAVLP